MYPYMNEDVAFERLKDLQREMENSRLTAGALAGFGRVARNLLGRRMVDRRPGHSPRAAPAPSSPSG